MAQWYNLTAVNASNMLEMTKSINELYMFDQLGNLILLVIFFISFISFTMFNQSPKIDMMYSSGAISILSIPLLLLGLVPISTVFLCWALFAVTLAITIINK